MRFPALSPSEKLRIVFAVFLIGLWGGSFLPLTLLSLVLLFSVIFFLIAWQWKWFSALVGGIFLVALFYGAWDPFHNENNHILPQLYGETLEMTGTVVSFPDRREKSVRAYVSVKLPEVKTNEKILLVLSPSYDIAYGDIISFSGKLQQPRNMKDFDYKKYLERFDVHTIVSRPKSFRILFQKTGGNMVMRWADKVRSRLATNLGNNLPQTHQTMAMGILLGIKHGFSPVLSTAFRNSGLQHILVVSGFNVTVILVFVSILFRRMLGGPLTFVISLFFLIFFVAMTGAEPPILRAAVMGAVVGWAATMGRLAEARNILLLSAAILALFQPKMIQEDLSFALSFVATMGIILGTPVLERCLSFITHRFALRTLLSTTLAAQLAVFPLLGFSFGTFPWIGIVSNLLVEPLIPWTMLFSFVTSVLGFLPGFIGDIISIPSFILLEIVISIASFFGQVQPMIIPHFVSYFGFVFVFGFFVWGNVSRSFTHTFLERDIDIIKKETS